MMMMFSLHSRLVHFPTRWLKMLRARMRRNTDARVVLTTDRITNQDPASVNILHPRIEIFSSADLLPSDVNLLMNFLMRPQVS